MTGESDLEKSRDLDTFTAITELNARPVDEIGPAYISLVKDLYWKNKDLDAVVLFARAGIQRILDLIHERTASDPKFTAELADYARALSYNLATFTWPGWDEPGIDCTYHVRTGLAAARLNLRLVDEFDRPPITKSRAHWILGAHLLAASDWHAAIAEFDTAAAIAGSAAQPGEEVLAMCFAALTSALSGTDSDAADNLASLRERLAAMDGGAGLDSQVETAKTVFSVGR